MELRLEQLIKDAGRIANVQNLGSENPIVVRLSNPSITTITAIVCAHEEPSSLVLPLNVTWFDFNPQSLNYKKALRRVSKDEDTVLGRDHTWEIVEEYALVFEAQIYDAADTLLLSNVSEGVVVADTTTLGIARLSATPSNPADPIVVVNTDPRLSDARDPLAHTHPAAPISELQTQGSVVTIGNAVSPQAGHVLVASSSTQAVWRALTTYDITL